MTVSREHVSYAHKEGKMHPPKRRSPSGIILEDGLDKKDLKVIDTLRDNGCVVFMHGSGMTAGKLGETSDIDFSVIGSIANTPTEIADKHLQGLDKERMTEIDYASFSTRAENGRKISLHLENPSFRSTYPDNPCATEYRDPNNKKQTKQPTYVLGGTDKSGTIYIAQVACPQIDFNGGTITSTPQTGIFEIQEGKNAIPAKDTEGKFAIVPILAIDDRNIITRDPVLPDEILLFGLGLNKMTEDTPVDSNDKFGEEKFISEPLKRSLKTIEEYTQHDPILLFTQSVYAREGVRADRKGKMNNSKPFVMNLSERLSALY